MAKELRLEEVRKEGSVTIGTLRGRDVVIGREPESPGAITVNNGAISREHGVFISAADQWFYRDLGSTNGSWINGEVAKGSETRVVRPGDVVQCADTALKVVGDQGPLRRALFVFREGAFVNEFAIPELGRVLVVGGPEADLSIDGMVEEQPSLVIEKRGDKVFAYTVSGATPVGVNGQEIREAREVSDRDRVTVASFEIVVANSKPASHMDVGIAKGPPSAVSGKASLRGWDSNQEKASARQEEWDSPVTKQPSKNSTFGKNIDDNEPYDAASTVALDPAEVERKLAKIDRHPSRRYLGDEGSEGPATPLEDKIVLLLGFVMVLALILLAVWWYFA